MRCRCGAPADGDAGLCKACSGSHSLSNSASEGQKKPQSVEEMDTWGRLSLPGGSRDEGPPATRATSDEIVPSYSVVLEGKYRLGAEIGRGAMGAVFLAEDILLQRYVAVKFLLPELTEMAGSGDRFRREAVNMAAIRNNNVAQIYSYGEHGSRPYFVMEYLDGESAENLVDSHNSRGFFIPMDTALDILIQALSGLSAIHQLGAVHRDIKPANIMLTGVPLRAVVTDFGLMRTVQMDDEIKSLAGTPAYIAPELIEGIEGAEKSPLVDIYSMGVTAYELFTGMLPFYSDRWVEILRKQITEIPLYPTERRPGLHEEIDEIVMRAMSKDPKERYASCQEFIDDLVRIEALAITEDERTTLPPGGRVSDARRSISGRMLRRSGSRSMDAVGKSDRVRLLVVDTDPEFRTFVHDAAKAAVPGCQIRSATDGATALDIIEEFRPHVVLLDLALPGLNGLEVVATLRGERRFDNMGIVVAAERGGDLEASILSEMRVSQFLNKPIDAQTLSEVLRYVLERYLDSVRGYQSEKS